MKTRIITLSALAVAAIAIFGCNKIEKSVNAPENAGIPFKFTAVNDNTKTTNDGVHTNWVAGDQVNLFHSSVAASYVEDGAFTAASDGASSVFSGTLASELTEDSYDWYALYPYNSYVHTPASESEGYITVGSQASAKQTQTGNSNMAHIAGGNYPVAGKALDVAKDVQPVINMNHLTSLVAVHVTNGLASPITVTEVALTGTEGENGIIGTYYVDFVSNPVKYTKSGASYVNNTATLQVTSGSAIAAGADATFYLAVKPFTAPAAGTLTLSVTADNGKQIKDKVLASAFSFDAGVKNTLNFTYDKVAVVSTYTKVTSLTADAEYLIVNAEAGKAATGTVTSGILQSDDVTISDGSITGSVTISGYEFTSAALTGVDAGYYTLKCGSNYVGWTSKTNLATSTTVDSDKYKWAITVDGESGLVTITNKSDATRFLGWNNTAGFKAYSTSNLATYPRPVLFKKN